MHWAAPYIGKRWAKEGDMVSSFNCFQLSCVVQRRHFNRDMPPIVLNTSKSDVALAIKSSRWRVSMAPPEHGDVLSMRNPEGPHVGVVIDVDGELKLLHSATCVHVTPLDQLNMAGYSKFKVWKYKNNDK